MQIARTRTPRDGGQGGATRHADVLRLRADARRAARAAGLKYVMDTAPGIRRLRKGKRFAYVDASGKAVRDAATLERIRALAIPPAWTDVWICPNASGHVQATGRDARKRKQYRYHASWSATRNEQKHRRICEFARLLPELRASCARKLRRSGLERETVLAALVRIVDLTAIRVGHEEYARQNASFGLTTLRVRHARVRGHVVELRFRGKSGIQRCVVFRDARVARLIADCRALRGAQLFQYLDDEGRARRVRARDLNAYLRTLTAVRYSIKDFRTWSATVHLAVQLRQCGAAASQRAAKQQLRAAIQKTAEHLGNTPTVCRSSYIHPGLLDAYLRGETLPPEPPRSGGNELNVLRFLERVGEGRGRRALSVLARAS